MLHVLVLFGRSVRCNAGDADTHYYICNDMIVIHKVTRPTLQALLTAAVLQPLLP
jgi:hypothetical protein